MVICSVKKCKMENIQNIINNLEDSTNKELLNYLEFLNNEFEKTKNSIINLTKYLDNVEIFYNKILKEYEKRNNV